MAFFFFYNWKRCHFESHFHMQGGSSHQLYKSVHSQVWNARTLSFFFLSCTLPHVHQPSVCVSTVPDIHIAKGHIGISCSWLQRLHSKKHFNTSQHLHMYVYKLLIWPFGWVSGEHSGGGDALQSSFDKRWGAFMKKVLFSFYWYWN